MTTNYPIEYQVLNLKLGFLRAKLILLFIALVPYVHAQVLETSTLTWDVIGLDSNKVNDGPNVFPVGTRVCNTGAVDATNVTATFTETGAANSYVEPQSGFPTTFTEATLTAGASPPNRHTISSTPSNCRDFYFNVEITRDKLAWETSQDYAINITSTEGATATHTGTLFVEKLVSQNRNSKVSLTGPTLLYVGETYQYTLTTSTATNGYEQLESIIDLPVVFETLSVSATYNKPSGAINSSPYADACGWDRATRDCVGPVNYSGGKAGGKPITSLYTVKVIGPGTGNFSSIIYDFSGSSFHYNNDYSVNPVNFISTVETWRAPIISKTFTPSLIAINETSTLTITLENASDNPADLTNVSLSDIYPANLVNALTPNASTTCGGTVSATAGDDEINLSAATLVKGVSCTITVDVTSSSVGDYDNVIPIDSLITAETISNQAEATATLQVREFDYGDAPSYASARHIIDMGNSFYLGSAVDHDTGNWGDGSDTNGNASDDDTKGSTPDDEDGVTIANLIPGGSTAITLSVTGNGYLNAWIDWDKNGDFTGPGEHIISDIQDNDAADTDTAGGIIKINITVPASNLGITYARFRWSKDAGVSSSGQATEGEVEDYKVFIGEAELAIIKTVDTSSAAILAGKITDTDNSGNVTPTDIITFEITVTNNGPMASNNIVITDSVPAGYSYISASITEGDSRDDSNPTSPGLSWTINSLALNTSVTLSFKAFVLENNLPTAYQNTSQISTADNPDSNTTNNSSSVTPDILRIVKYVCNESLQSDGTCDLGATGAADPADDFVFSVSGSPGDILIYRIEYENFATEITDFDFSDNVPIFTNLLENTYGTNGEAQVECHANGTSSTKDIDLGLVSTITLDITHVSICNGPILPNESGAVMFKAQVN